MKGTGEQMKGTGEQMKGTGEQMKGTGEKMRELYQLQQLRQLQGPLPRHLLARNTDPTLVLSRMADALTEKHPERSYEELRAVPERPVKFFDADAATSPAEDEPARAYTIGTFKGAKPLKHLPHFKHRPGSAPARRAAGAPKAAAVRRPASRAE
eukprot:TRINITY_DN5681_c1_g2_i1.p4 TRINITY_DN5681_c1_g2~~TRINITY_DN5681_c1_g2_i1.p4  ORF type:complete len:154 (+),score=37.55 TRINITY_DN5681_c1_g2_i1:1-462(+)